MFYKKETLKEEESDEDMDMDSEEDMDMEDDEIDLEDMSEDDLKSFIEDVIEDMVAAGELGPGEEMEVKDDSMDMDMDSEDDIDIDVEDDVTVDENARTDAEEEGYKDGMEDEKEDLSKDLKEAMETVAILRSELNEINLLNAKLLYTNKVFRAKNLSESQKVKVLGAFDKATNIKEAKLVFETINSSVKSKFIKPISESFKGSASASTYVASNTKRPILESDEMVARFQKLAGIIR